MNLSRNHEFNEFIHSTVCFRILDSTLVNEGRWFSGLFWPLLKWGITLDRVDWVSRKVSRIILMDPIIKQSCKRLIRFPDSHYTTKSLLLWQKFKMVLVENVRISKNVVVASPCMVYVHPLLNHQKSNETNSLNCYVHDSYTLCLSFCLLFVCLFV